MEPSGQPMFSGLGPLSALEVAKHARLAGQQADLLSASVGIATMCHHF